MTTPLTPLIDQLTERLTHGSGDIRVTWSAVVDYVHVSVGEQRLRLQRVGSQVQIKCGDASVLVLSEKLAEAIEVALQREFAKLIGGAK